MVFDVLAVGATDLMAEPFRDRRRVLETLSRPFAPPVHLAPSTLERDMAHDWYVRFEGAGLDGLMAKPRDDPYRPDKRAQLKVKHTRTVDVAVAGYRLHADGKGVGSLLVGLYDDEGNLHHCGVAASFTARRRGELMDELAPYVLPDPADHPWAAWMNPDAHAGGTTMPGTPNRWSSVRGDRGWTPVRIELVAEVRYEAMLNGRFRGTTRLVRWRPDRIASSCRFDQVEVPVPIGISEVLAAADRSEPKAG